MRIPRRKQAENCVCISICLATARLKLHSVQPLLCSKAACAWNSGDLLNCLVRTTVNKSITGWAASQTHFPSHVLSAFLDRKWEKEVVLRPKPRIFHRCQQKRLWGVCLCSQSSLLHIWLSPSLGRRYFCFLSVLQLYSCTVILLLFSAI